jgi:hypothetical protein
VHLKSFQAAVRCLEFFSNLLISHLKICLLMLQLLDSPVQLVDL